MFYVVMCTRDCSMFYVVIDNEGLFHVLCCNVH